jgi:hypothetical protein
VLCVLLLPAAPSHFVRTMPPTPTRRRYVCLGVGGVGGTICAKLAQSGAPVVAIARGEHLRTIQARGLRLRTPAEDVTLPVHALSSASELEPALGAEDVVIVATKSHQALSALDDLARLCEPDDEPAIVCCTNGLNTERASLRCFPRTYGMLVMLGGTHLVAGEVRCFASVVHGWLDIGCYPSGIDPLCKVRLRQHTPRRAQPLVGAHRRGCCCRPRTRTRYVRVSGVVITAAPPLCDDGRGLHRRSLRTFGALSLPASPTLTSWH